MRLNAFLAFSEQNYSMGVKFCDSAVIIAASQNFVALHKWGIIFVRV